MNIKYLVEVTVRHRPDLYRVLNGFPLHEGDKIKNVQGNVVTFYVDDWHLRESQTTFLLSRRKILTYNAQPVAGPSIAKDKVFEYPLVALAS